MRKADESPGCGLMEISKTNEGARLSNWLLQSSLKRHVFYYLADVESGAAVVSAGVVVGAAVVSVVS